MHTHSASLVRSGEDRSYGHAQSRYRHYFPQVAVCCGVLLHGLRLCGQSTNKLTNRNGKMLLPRCGGCSVCYVVVVCRFDTSQLVLMPIRQPVEVDCAGRALHQLTPWSQTTNPASTQLGIAPISSPFSAYDLEIILMCACSLSNPWFSGRE